MANIRLRKGQVDPKNPHATSVKSPTTLKTVNIDNVDIRPTKKANKFDYKNIIVTEAPEDLTDPLQEVLEYGYEIEIYNYSENIKKDFTTLEKALSKPKYMLGNCFSVSSSIIENIEEYDVPEGYTYDNVQLLYKKGVHNAIEVKDEEGNNWIVDYTAQQYDPNLPKPLTASKEEWEELIDHYVKTLHNDERK